MTSKKPFSREELKAKLCTGWVKLGMKNCKKCQDSKCPYESIITEVETNARLECEAEFKEIFMDLLWQTCGDDSVCESCLKQNDCPFDDICPVQKYDSQCLKAYENALAFAVKMGWIKKEQVIR